MMKEYLSLREAYPRFAYRGYDIDENDSELKVTYRFETEGLASFAPQWTFPKAESDHSRWSHDQLIQDMVFSLGMVELISYWKIACPPTVLVETGRLNEEQIRWWKDLYFNGLGEFFYVNKIESASLEHFMDIVCKCGGEEQEGEVHERLGPDTPFRSADVSEPCSEPCPRPRSEPSAQPCSEPSTRPCSEPCPRLSSQPGRDLAGVLVPIGGGKDSAVTLELLRAAGKSIYGYIINPRGATIHTTQVAGLDTAHVISVRRTLDPHMLELNREGYLNGHTPFSALVAFSSLIAARMYGLSMIALSNESSANESTVQGSTVNHQYSKSFKFEEDFHFYRTKYLPGSAYYFSMLRPLSEFQIAKYFARQKQYHKIFRSCNAGSRTDSWCGHCPKCLFVYLILSPFLSAREVEEIFGRNMLEDETMKGTLDQLIGIEEEKPFECVGSRDEINTAMVLTIHQMEADGERLPSLLSYYKTTGLYQIYRDKGDQYSSYYDEKNLVPDELAQLITGAV